jgi:altronate dehydratase
LPELIARDWVIVLGCGGLGMAAIAMLRARGVSNIVACDVDAAKLERARAQGASASVDTRNADALAQLQTITGGAIAGALDFVGMPATANLGIAALAKGGQAPLSAVYDYAETIHGPGFAFMDTPGFDPVSMTGLVCGGCNVGVFTSGRGSVYGCKPMPCLKIATNTTLYDWMRDDMDLNAGTILDGTETVEQVGQRIFEEIIAVANGKRTKSELQGIGDEEFAPWILGPVL